MFYEHDKLLINVQYYYLLLNLDLKINLKINSILFSIREILYCTDLSQFYQFAVTKHNCTIEN